MTWKASSVQHENYLYSGVKMRKPFLPSFLIFLLYRLSSVLIIQTSYVPDEYWQSLEVAHNMAFGYGYLTWEWKHGLRSYLYPSIFAIVYQTLKFFHMDYVYLITLTPKLVQAFLTAMSDHYFVLLCRSFGLDEYWSKTYIFTNWFWYYCGSRTVINTFETSLTIISLYYFPWILFIKKSKGKKKWGISLAEMKIRYLKYMTLSAISCIVRPTAVNIWGPLVIFHLTCLTFKDCKALLLNCVLPVSLCVLSISMVVDFVWYGRFVIPAYNFLTFNILKNISSFYGAHPFYWYLSQGLPVTLGLQILPFALGLASLFRELFARKNSSLEQVFIIWIIIIVFNILILSSIPHKEFRFILPLLPLMSLIAVKKSSEFFKSSRQYKVIWTFLLILGFIIPAIVFGVFHQRGSLLLMDYLSGAAINCTSNCLFLFLMPCHSTPLYSHLHVNISTRFLLCEPPIDDNFYDESDDFFKNPHQWLQRYWDDSNIPSHVAFFDCSEDFIGPFLKSKGYIKKNEFFHTMFPEGNLGKYILVYEPL